jgi:hypothetical protein
VNKEEKRASVFLVDKFAEILSDNETKKILIKNGCLKKLEKFTVEMVCQILDVPYIEYKNGRSSYHLILKNAFKNSKDAEDVIDKVLMCKETLIYEDNGRKVSSLEGAMKDLGRELGKNFDSKLKE